MTQRERHRERDTERETQRERHREKFRKKRERERQRETETEVQKKAPSEKRIAFCRLLTVQVEKVSPRGTSRMFFCIVQWRVSLLQ